MLAQSELKRIAKSRLQDAEALLQAGRYDGALYLCGYAVEISLKIRICKTLKWAGFPERNKEFDGFQSFKTHDLNNLFRLSGIEITIRNNCLKEWSIVTTWNPEARYGRVGDVSQVDAVTFLEATKILLKLL